MILHEVHIPKFKFWLIWGAVSPKNRSGASLGGHFRERTKIQQKRPKFAGPIYFHAEVYLEVILESVRKSNKKGPNLPARFIFTRMYVWKFAKVFFVAVFTNFAATLTRQPSAACLARSALEIKGTIFREISCICNQKTWNEMDEIVRKIEWIFGKP